MWDRHESNNATIQLKSDMCYQSDAFARRSLIITSPHICNIVWLMDVCLAFHGITGLL